MLRTNISDPKNERNSEFSEEDIQNYEEEKELNQGFQVQVS